MLQECEKVLPGSDEVQPMKDPFRNVRLYWLRLLNAKEVRLGPIRVHAAAESLPRFVRTAILKKTYELSEREIISRVLQPGDRVLEIGAGVGVVSVLCAHICGEGAVLSYEANPLLEPLIRKNYELNGIRPNVRMKAITVEGHPITFFRDDNILSSSAYDRNLDAAKITVESDPIDAAIDEHRPTTIVMDVEGAEIELLVASHLRGVKRLILEIHPHIVGDQPIEKMLDRLKSMGFVVEQTVHKTVLLTRA